MKEGERLYRKFESIFRDQLGLELVEAVTLNDNDTLTASSDMKLGVSMATMQLNLSNDDHGECADFLTLINQ